MSRSIKITGEYTIDSIIGQEYGGLSPEEHAEKKCLLARLNPHIVSLESFTIGDEFFLEDEFTEEKGEREEKSIEEDGEPTTKEISTENIPDELPVDETIHVPAVKRKRQDGARHEGH